MTGLTERREVFRSAIASFIEARREAKLKGKEGDADTASKYDYAAWLADAAKRAGSIQLVTHPLKATFPDAKIKETTSPFIQGKDLPKHQEIGSHLIDHEFFDGTGDAASLGTFKLLTEVVVEGKPLIHWLLTDDPDLLFAFCANEAKAEQIASDLKRVHRSNQPPASHTGAKQIYWLTGKQPSNDADYHLLQPLFSSSLAHAVHADIQDARFGEPNKLARQAFRAREAHESHYRDYRNLVVRKLGGTKPQNISQLNSERGGINYLLPSLPPPRWDQDRFRQLLGIETALDRFAHFKGVRFLVKTLADFLLSDPDKTMQTRDRREAIEQALGFQLPVFAASILSGSEPGWTRDPLCRLPLCEQLWLDPERTELPLREGHEQEDDDFIVAYQRGDWPDEVAGRFANWVNAQLHEAGLTTVGDTEYKQWARQAIVDAAWPVPMQQRVLAGGEA